MRVTHSKSIMVSGFRKIKVLDIEGHTIEGCCSVVVD